MNEQVQAMLLQVAEKLGTTVEHLWGVLLTQAKIEGIVELCCYLLLPIFLYCYFRWLKWLQKNQSDQYDCVEFCQIFATILWGIGAIIFCLAAVFGFSHMLSCFLNPEYVALKELLSMLATVK